MGNPAVSVIVPVYNTGKELGKCIESILAQAIDNIELILVNDGSSDNSGEICDEYAKKDKRITVIHKENEGVSVARNTAIAVAKGEYLGFIDSDDWIDENMYSDLYDIACRENVDVVMSDTTTIYDSGVTEPDTITQLSGDVRLDKKDISPKLLYEIAGSTCKCIYKRSLIEKNNIIFPVGIKLSEDRIFNLYAIGSMQSMFYHKKSYYFRYVRSESACNKYYENMIDIVLISRQGVMKALSDAWDNDSNYTNYYEKQIIQHGLMAINNEFYKTAKNSYIEKYKNIKKICNTPELQNAIDIFGSKGLRLFLIKKKFAFSLCVLTMILNKIKKR